MIIITGFLLGFVAAYIASYRGRNPYTWFFVGALFGVLGIVILLLLDPAKKTETEESQEGLGKNIDLVEDSPAQPDRTAISAQGLLSQDWFYLDQMHKQHGSISLEELKNCYLKGIVKAETYVWSKGMEEWKRITELPDLFHALKTQ